MSGSDQCRRRLPLLTVWFAPVMAHFLVFSTRGLHWNKDHRHPSLSGGERC